MAWKPPANAEWVPPEEAQLMDGTVPMNEIVNDPRAAGLDVPAEIPAEVVPEQGGGWLQAALRGAEAAFPASSAAADLPPWHPRALTAAGMDFAGLPWRLATAGVQQGAQAAADAMEMGGDIRRTFLEDLGRTGADPELGGFTGAIEAGARSPLNTIAAPVMALRAPAALLAQSPAWLRGAVAGAQLGANAGNRTLQAGRAAVGAIPVGLAAAAVGQGERYGQRQPLMSARDATVTALSAPALASLGPAAQSIGAGLKRGAVQALRQMVKPTSTELEGFYQAMGAGLLPEAAGMFTLTPGGAGERFIGRMRARSERAYAPAVAEAEASGATVNMDRVMRDASRSLRDEVDAGKIAIGEDDIANTREWLGKKLLYRDQAGRDALEVANIPIQGRYVPLMGQEEIRAQLPRTVGMDAYGMPITEARDAVIGYRPKVEGFEKLPDYYEPVPDVVRPVVPAHRLKSAMQDEAYPGRDPKATAPIAGQRAAAKGADRAIRSQIAEVSPKYAAADAEMTPWYAGADAFQRAADVRGGNYGLDVMAGLIGGGAGIQSGIGNGIGGLLTAAAAARYARSPALARHLWEVGRAGESLGSRLMASPYVAPMAIQAARTDNARGGR